MEGTKDQITFTSTHAVPQSLYRFHRGNDERPFLSDTDLVCKGGYIPVHSVILMAGSPILKEHITDQSPAQRDHMVVHLSDYHITDMTHVVTCFYTGTCTFPRNRANTIFEIFEQLGVNTRGMSYAVATDDELKKRSYIRRYLDCDEDDDDMFIEDGEVISLGDIPTTAWPNNAIKPGDQMQPKADEQSVVPGPSSEPDPPVSVVSDEDNHESESKSRNKKKRRKVVLLPKPQPPEVKFRGAVVHRDGVSGIKNTDTGSQADDSDNDNIKDSNDIHNTDEDMSEGEIESVDNGKEDKNKSDSSDDEPVQKRKAPSKRKASANIRKRSKRVKKSESRGKSSGKKSDEEEGSIYKASDDEDDDEDESEHSEPEDDSESFIVDDASSEDREFVVDKKSLRSRSVMTRGQKNLRKLPTRKTKTKEQPVKTRSGLRQLRNRTLPSRNSKHNSDDDDESDASEESEEQEDPKKRACNTKRSRKRTNKLDDSDSSENTSEEQELDEASNFRRGTGNDEGSNSSEDDDSDDDQEDIDPAERCYLRSLVIKINKIPDDEIQKHCRRREPQERNESIKSAEDTVANDSSKSNSASCDTSRNNGKPSRSKISPAQPSSSKGKARAQSNSLPPGNHTKVTTPALVNEINSVVNDKDAKENEASSFSVSPQQAKEAIKACLPPTNIQICSEAQSHSIISNTKKWMRATFNCPVCKKDFPNHVGASRCIKSHNKFRCWICLEVCDVSMSIEHCKTVHSNEKLKENKTNCPICQQVVSWNGVQNHISQTHFEHILGQESSINSQPSDVVAGSSSGSDKQIDSEDENTPLVTIKDPRLLFESDHDDDSTNPDPGPPSGTVALPQPGRPGRKPRGKANQNSEHRMNEDRRIAEEIARERPKRKLRNANASRPIGSSTEVVAESASGSQGVSTQGFQNLVTHTPNRVVATENQPSTSTPVEITKDATELAAHIRSLRSGSTDRVAAKSPCLSNSSVERITPSSTNRPAERINASLPDGSSEQTTAVGENSHTNITSAVSVPTPLIYSTLPETVLSDPPICTSPLANSGSTLIRDNSPVRTNTDIPTSSSAESVTINGLVASVSKATTPPIPAGSANLQSVSQNTEEANKIASQIINQLRINSQSSTASVSNQTHNNPPVLNDPIVAPQSQISVTSPVSVNVGNQDSVSVGGVLPVPGSLITRLISNAPSPSLPTGSLILSSRNAAGTQMPVSYQSVVNQQPTYGAMQPSMNPPAAIGRRNSLVSYQPPTNLGSGKVVSSNAVPMMLSSRDLSSVASAEASTSRFCGTTTIGGVPFKIFSRSGAAEPHPQAIVTVSEDRTYTRMCNIRTPQNAARPNQSYPIIPNLDHHMMAATQNFQNALQVQESRDRRQSSTGDSRAVGQRNHQTLEIENADNRIRCERCEEQFRCQDSYEHHLCLGPED